jgi:hypothetical protein
MIDQAPCYLRCSPLRFTEHCDRPSKVLQQILREQFQRKRIYGLRIFKEANGNFRTCFVNSCGQLFDRDEILDCSAIKKNDGNVRP